MKLTKLSLKRRAALAGDGIIGTAFWVVSFATSALWFALFIRCIDGKMAWSNRWFEGLSAVTLVFVGVTQITFPTISFVRHLNRSLH